MIESVTAHVDLALLKHTFAAGSRVGTAGKRGRTGRDACTGDKCERSDSFRIIDSDHTVRACYIGAIAKAPDDFVGFPVHFNNSVVELVGDENVPEATIAVFVYFQTFSRNTVEFADGAARQIAFERGVDRRRKGR